MTRSSLVGMIAAAFLYAVASVQLAKDMQAGRAWPTPDTPGIQATSDDRSGLKTCKEAYHSKNVSLMNSSCLVALRPVELNIEEGMYDIVFKILHEYQDDKYQYLQQNMWRALSDQSFTERGSYCISNYAGPNTGVEYMVKQLFAHPAKYAFCEDHLDVQYETLACLQGLLWLDNNNTRGPAAVKAGLVPAIVRTFEMESDVKASTVFACKAMSSVLMRNPDYASLFKDAGVLKHVDRTIELFKNSHDTSEFHFGVTVDEYFQINACDYPRLMMMGDREHADKLVQNEVAGFVAWKPWLNIKM